MNLIFPTKILDQHLVVLGKTGAGKSSALRHVVEHLLDHNKRVCVVDPKGDWNGLKVSADGKTSGYPVILFGDFKETAGKAIPADVPLNEYSGKHIADLVTSGNRPCVIGLRGWTQGEMHRFWIDFASTFFNSNEGEFYLIVDEVHNFAPKGKILSPEVGKCLHWTNRLLSEARGLGAVMLIASQRPQKVHNDTLTACETLVAMRVIHKADRDAIDDWIKGCGDPAVGKDVLNSLAGMKRGEAFVWSPEVEFGPTRLTFPMFKTFDSFAPPQLQKKVSGKDWSTVDLAEVKEKLAVVIEKAKAEDPRELNKTIAELKKQLASKPRAETPKPVVEFREVPVLGNGQLTELRECLDLLGQLSEGLVGVGEGIRLSAETITREMGRTHATPGAFAISPKPQRIPAQRIGSPRPSASSNNGEVGQSGLRRILVALAQRPQGLSARQIGVRAGLSSKSGSFNTYLSRGRSNAWIVGDRNLLQITDDGLQALGDFEPLPSGDDLLRYWIAELGASGASRILEVLADEHPDSLTKEEVGERTGLSASSGSFNTYLSRLRALELIEGRGELRASDELFGT